MDDGCSLSTFTEGRLCLLQKNLTENSDLLDIISQNSGTIILLFILLAFSAFFSSSETAITAVSKIRIKAMADNNVRPAKTALGLMNNFDRSITTILVGNNIVNIAMSSFSTLLAIHLGIDVMVMTLCVTAIVILFGEVLPKSLAKEFGESYTLKIAAPLRFMGIVLCQEILNIVNEDAETVVLGGKEQIKKAMALILKEKTNKNIIELDEKTVDYSTSIGMVKIYEHTTK